MLLKSVKEVLFHMHPDKSLDPDGMTPGFHQKFWSTVGGDVVRGSSSFLNMVSLIISLFILI